MTTKYILSLVVEGQDHASGPLGRASGALGNFGSVVGGILSAGAIIALGRQIWELGSSAFNAAVSFESAFAGIIKTTDGLVDAGGKLTGLGESIYQQFRDLATQIPITFEELARIGELGGQLGVAEDQLASFTNTIAALGVSTNLTTEEAAIALARLQNIYDIATEDMGINTERLGSTIVALGNNFATTERDIVAYAERLAGAGKIAGLTQPEILAIGAAMSSVGVEAEAGGTAVQKVLLSMTEGFQLGGEAADKWGEALGTTAKEFTDAWANDPMQVFQDFITELGSGSESAIQILSDLGLEDQRLIRAFLSLAEAGDLITETVDTANLAWEENLALMTEAERRYATTQSQIQITKNKFRDFGASLGEVVLPKFNEFLTSLTPFFETVAPQLIQNFSDLVSGGGQLGQVFDTIKNSVVSAGEALAPFVERLITWGEGMSTALGPSFEQIGETISTTFTKLSEAIGPALLEMLDSVVTWLEENGPLISAFFDRLSDIFENLGPIVVQVWAVLQPLLQGLLDLILGLGRLIMQVALGDWTGAWNTIQAIAVNVWNALSGAFMAFLELIATTMGTSLAELGATWSFIWESLKVYAALIWESIKTTVVGGITSMVASVVSKFTEFGAKVRTSFETISNNVKTVLDTIKTNISTAFTNALTNAMSMAGRFVDVGKGIIDGIVRGISNNIQKVLSSLAGVIEKAIASVLGALGIHSPSTVFAGIGENVIAGLAQGISSNPLAVDAIEGQATAIQRPFSQASSGGSVSSTANSVVIQVNGAGDPEKVAGEIMRLLKLQGVYA